MTKHDFESFWGKMTKFLKMTQNDSKNDWKGHEWVKLTINIRKKVKRTRNNQKWPKIAKCHYGKNDKKWLKMSLKGSNICSKIDVTPKYQLFNL